MSMPNAALRHPTKPMTSSSWSDLVMVEETRLEDPAWHFRMALRWPARVAPTRRSAIVAVGAPQLLAHYRREQAQLDIEVVGHLLEREIDPAHWLEEVLRIEGWTVLSSQPVQLRSGLVGDLLARRSDDGVHQLGRFFASKWGPRIFLLSFRCPEVGYDAVADELLASIASFEAIDDSLGMFGELVKPLRFDCPVAWQTMLPDSWSVQRSPSEEAVGGFQAALLRDFDMEHLDGKLALGVALRSVAGKPRKAAQMFLNAVRFNDIELEHEQFDDEAAEPPFERSWCCVTSCFRESLRGELRCRVMMHPQFWVVGGVIGPQRQDDSFAWAQNKRTLDVVTSTLSIK